MNILNANKAFSDVRVGEQIWYIDPKTQEVKPVTVTGSQLHPKSTNKMVWAIKFYMPFRIDSISKEALDEAKKFGTTVENTIVMLKSECMVILQSEIPMAFATEKAYLEKWKNAGKSGLIAPKRNA